jgi:hypothetical protein
MVGATSFAQHVALFPLNDGDVTTEAATNNSYSHFLLKHIWMAFSKLSTTILRCILNRYLHLATLQTMGALKPDPIPAQYTWSCTDSPTPLRPLGLTKDNFLAWLLCHYW